MIKTYKDYTLKAIITGADEIEATLIELGAHFIGLDKQKDHYFETEKGKLKWRKGTIENLITHYERIIANGVERTVVYQYDLNPTQSEINYLLENRRVIGIVEKERKIYTILNIKIHIDTLKDNAQFLEIEAIDREGVFSDHELISQCNQLKTLLNLKDSQLVKTGYLI